MTLSPSMTRCPHCQTSFRVTAQQLSAAGGKVRCGHCMKVFNALEHQAGLSPAQQAPTAAKAAPVEAASPTRPTVKQDKPPHEDEFGDALQALDDMVFADNPEEDRQERGYQGSSRFQDQLSDSFTALDAPGSDENFKDNFKLDAPDVAADADESWAAQMLADDQELAISDQPADPAPAAKPRAVAKTSQKDWAVEPIHTHAQPAAHSASAPRQAPALTPEPRPAQRAAHDYTAHDYTAHDYTAHDKVYDNLRVEPIALSPPPGAPWRGIIWGLVSLALLGTAVAQVGWFQFDRLSRIEALRPYYEKACAMLACQLPALVDLSRIESQKLVVRASNAQKGALEVSAEIINQATFEQPFPGIAMTFSNLNGDVVAQRIFKPAEYLSGEAQGMTQMPSKTPVQIALLLKDPGRDAVNYQIDFYPAVNN